MAEQEQKKTGEKIELLRRVFRFTAPYRRQFYFSVALAIFLAVISPLRPWLIQVTITHGVKQSGGWGFFHDAASVIVGITLIQLGLLLAETVCRFIFTFFTASLGQNVVKDIRVKTYGKIVQYNLSQFDRTPIGTLTTRTINDIESINDIFSDGLIPIIADLLSIVAVLTYMFMTSWKITLVCLLPFPGLIFATYFFKESVNRSYLKVRNAVAQLNAFVQEHITGMSVVQAFAAEDRELGKFRAINKKHRDANIRSILAYSVFFPVVELVAALSTGLLVWWAAKLAAGPGTQTDIAGIVTSFILCLNLLFRPLRVLADKFNVLQMGIIASERVFKVLDNPDTTVNQGTRVTPLAGQIEFKDVWFAYTPGQHVLKGITFSIAAGKTLAIVGNTGSGKTSVISLINRLYQHQQGYIRIDGVEIDNYEIGFLRSRIAVVLQDVFLFSGSVYDNLTLRNPAIRKEQVYEAARMIGIHDFILQLPGGYDYNVMERGATLSMGQRQLLSFVRALLYDPAILILDEATSSIDAESEKLIQQAIEKLVAGRTSIIIAHRLSTIRKADQILVLEKGEVKESGTHEALLASNGIYARLYQMQFSVSYSL